VLVLYQESRTGRASREIRNMAQFTGADTREITIGSGYTVGEMRSGDSIQQARELAVALSRFCRSIEEIAALRFDTGGNSPDKPESAGRALSADATVQLLALTELVQHTLHVVGEILTEVEPSRVARHS